MLKNVLLMGMINWFPDLKKLIKDIIPDILITLNYEEVLALVKTDEVKRLCIIIGGYNYSKKSCNTIEGFEAAQELHRINSELPILVIEGAKKRVGKLGTLEIISTGTKNVVYIENDGLIRNKFFSGELFQEFYCNEVMP